MLKWLFSLTCTFTALSATGFEWQTDYTLVRQVSETENKPMLLFFNGSDWAGSAMKMKHEILNTPEFQEKVGDKFLFLEIDFPKHTAVAESLIHQNQQLKARYKIQDFPTLLMLDHTERVMAKIDYLPEKGEKLAADLLQILELDAKLNAGLQNLNSSTIQLKELYRLAQELGSQEAVDQILAAGVRGEDPFFVLERYRFLVEKGEMKSAEASNLKKKLYELAPQSELFDGQSIPFTLALIDFQELSQGALIPEIAAQPLAEYLEKFAAQDSKNVWRVEMMIAQLYADAEIWEKALLHAERARVAAPESVLAELAQSLDYIRSAKNSLQ